MPKKQLSLEQAQNRIDEILDIMSDSALPFEQLLKYYEEASSLLAFSYNEINNNKGKFEQLRDKLESCITSQKGGENDG